MERVKMKGRKRTADSITGLAEERTKLANERTFLAYVRTGLTALLFGLGVLEFLGNSPLVTYVGVLAVLGGLGFLALGTRHYFASRKEISEISRGR